MTPENGAIYWRHMNFIRGNVAWDGLKVEIQKVAHRGHAQKWPNTAKITFSLNIPNLDNHCGQTSNEITEYFGIVHTS